MCLFPDLIQHFAVYLMYGKKVVENTFYRFLRLPKSPLYFIYKYRKVLSLKKQVNLY